MTTRRNNNFFIFSGVVLACLCLLGLASAQTPFPYSDVYHLYPCDAGDYFAPSSYSEVQTIINNARAAGKNVKAVGSAHSANGIICVEDGGVAVWLGNLDQVLEINGAQGFARVQAGASVANFQEALIAEGYVLDHTPQFGGITIGGALGTGAHGSTLTRSASLSDQVVSMTFVNGKGELVVADTPQQLRYASVHLGLLGIVVEVTFRIEPLFKIKSERFLYDQEVVLNGSVLQQAANADYLAVNWFPGVGKAIVTKFTKVPVTEEGNDFWGIFSRGPAGEAVNVGIEIAAATRDVDLQCQLAASEVDYYANGGLYLDGNDGVTPKNPAVGFPNLMLSLASPPTCVGPECPPSFFPFSDSSVAVKASRFTQAAKFISDLVNQDKTKYCFVFSGGIYLRFLGGSPAAMATHNGEDHVMFEMISLQRLSGGPGAARLRLDVLQEIEQALVNKFQGKPHWGKNGQEAFTKLVLQYFPNQLGFRNYRNAQDPDRVFDNKFARLVFGPGNERPEEGEYCAVYSRCRCKIFGNGSNGGCGDNQYCTLGSKFILSTVCADKKASGSRCLLSRECSSGRCRFFRCT